MKMVSRITAIGLAGVAICYLGLSGYVWYHDNKRSKQADVQALSLIHISVPDNFVADEEVMIVAGCLTSGS